jgi:hypothetical protein
MRSEESERLAAKSSVSCRPAVPQTLSVNLHQNGVAGGARSEWVDHPTTEIPARLEDYVCSYQRTRNELGSYIPEDGIRHSHRRENLSSSIALTGWGL